VHSSFAPKSRHNKVPSHRKGWPWPYCDWHIHHDLMVHKCWVQDACHALWWVDGRPRDENSQNMGLDSATPHLGPLFGEWRRPTLGALLDTHLRFLKHPKPVMISILCTTEWSSSFLLCWVGHYVSLFRQASQCTQQHNGERQDHSVTLMSGVADSMISKIVHVGD